MRIAEIETKLAVAEEKPVVVQMSDRALASAKIRREKATLQASQKKSRDRLRKLQQQSRKALTDDSDPDGELIKSQKKLISSEECGAIYNK